MNRTTLTVVAVATLATVGLVTPAAAQHAAVTSFDVAGVRLHASPAQARAALAQAGYRITYATTTASFDQEVAAEAARRRGASPTSPKQLGTGMFQAAGPHREYMEIKFMQTPGGSEVADVVVTVPSESITADAFGRQLVAKYGEPDARRSMRTEWSWCSPETRANCGATIAVSGLLGDQYPLLTATVQDGAAGRIRLQVGETAFPALAAVKEQTVQRLAPKTTRAAF